MKCKITNATEKGITAENKNGNILQFDHNDFKVIKQCDEFNPLIRKTVYFDGHRKVMWHLSLGGSFAGKSNSYYSDYGLFDSRVIEGVMKIRIYPKVRGHFLRLNMAKLKMETIEPFSMWHLGGGYEFILSRKKISPFFYGNVGYGYGLKVIKDQDEVNGVVKYNNKGGFNYETGLGLILRSSYGYAFTLSSSFFYQPATIEIKNITWGSSNLYDLTLRRSFLKLGFVF